MHAAYFDSPVDEADRRQSFTLAKSSYFRPEDVKPRCLGMLRDLFSAFRQSLSASDVQWCTLNCEAYA